MRQRIRLVRAPIWLIRQDVRLSRASVRLVRAGVRLSGNRFWLSENRVRLSGNHIRESERGVRLSGNGFRLVRNRLRLIGNRLRLCWNWFRESGNGLGKAVNGAKSMVKARLGGAPITHGEIPPPAVQKQDTPCPVSRFLESDPPSATAPPRASPPRPPMSSGPCHDAPSGTQLWQGQRPDLIPAWANGPGHRAPTVKGQRPDPDLWANAGRIGSGLQPSVLPRGLFLGRWPRLVWVAPLALRRQRRLYKRRKRVQRPRDDRQDNRKDEANHP